MRPAELIEAILDAASTEVVVSVETGSGLNVRWANSTTTTNGSIGAASVAIAAIDDGRVGSIAQTLSGDEDPVALVRAAEAACAGKPVADDRMPLLEGDGTPPGDWDAPPADAAPGLFARAAAGIEAMFDAARDAGDDTFGYAEHDAITTWLATSAGVRRRATVERGSLSFTVRAGSRSTWAGQWVPDWDAIDPVAAYRRLRERLDASREATQLPAGRYEVLLSPSAVADMMTYFTWLATLRDAADGQSPFSKAGGGTRLGERLTQAPVTLSSDPSEPGLAGLPFVATTTSSQYSSVFDAGMERGRIDFVRDGELVNLIAPRAVARDHDAQPVAMPTNLLLQGDGDSLERMIAATEGPALLVNALWYIRLVDPRSMLLTGLTRDGVYLVRDGAIQGEVNNFRWNVSPLDMLANIVEIGGAVPTLPREFETSVAKAPPLRVADWHMSSVSEAT